MHVRITAFYCEAQYRQKYYALKEAYFYKKMSPVPLETTSREFIILIKSDIALLFE